jgi:hypothetical protein
MKAYLKPEVRLQLRQATYEGWVRIEDLEIQHYQFFNSSFYDGKYCVSYHTNFLHPNHFEVMTFIKDPDFYQILKPEQFSDYCLHKDHVIIDIPINIYLEDQLFEW